MAIMYWTRKEEYCTPCRGDVGSWVREASMEGLVSLAACLLQIGGGQNGRWGRGAKMQSIVQGLICGMLQQAVERIARVREVRQHWTL